MKKHYFAVANIKTLLKQRGITLKGIAKDVGVSNQYLLNVFSGQRNLNLELFCKITDILNLTDKQAIRLTIDDKISTIGLDEKCIKADCILQRQNSTLKPAEYIKEAIEEDVEEDKLHLVRIITEKSINKPLNCYDDVIHEVVDYLYTTFYRDMFKQIETKNDNKQKISDVLSGENEILTEIINLSKDLDIQKQRYIRDSIKLYLNLL